MTPKKVTDKKPTVFSIRPGISLYFYPGNSGNAGFSSDG